MEMSKYLENAKAIANLINDIGERFAVDIGDIKIDTDEMVGLILVVKLSVIKLADLKWSDADFHIFCKENDLSGVIFFNKDGTVSFSMTPTFVKKSKQMQIISTQRTLIVPRLTNQMFECMHSGNKVNATKLYREQFGLTLAEAKQACEQGYLLEIKERNLTSYPYNPEFMPFYAAVAVD